jgi:hypothetical protein
MVVIAIYAIVWNKVHKMPINDKVPLENLVKEVRERSEYLAVWDEAVADWLKTR